MSQVKPPSQGSGQRPGPQARKPAPGKRPPAKTGPKGRPATAGKGTAGGGAKGRTGRPNKTISAPPPRRFSPSTLAFGAVGVVVVIVLVFVVVTVTGKKSPSSSTSVPPPTPASAAVLSEVTGVPASVASTVGTGQGVTAPQVLKNQPLLTSGGKPEVLFIGAEFCPYCAAERWATVMALSHFGTWSGLKETTSSLWDTDPGTATFSFRDAKLTSSTVSFVGVEHETNDTNGAGTRKNLQPLTTAQGKLWTKYAAQFGINTGYPFLDFGNKVFVTGPSYDPAILAGLNQQDIASRLSNPSDPVTQAIVGTSNYLTAAVCSLTGNQPAAVCSASGVHKAAAALKLS
ncbi:MAG TPA: DUF929 family protein [Acidimicrobiales bacterium]|nr:DUF929 family protein [Acidimicrobiales bacterium]